MSEDNIIRLITLAVVVAVIIGVILLIKSAVDSAKRKVRNMLNSSLLGQIKAATEETAKTPATLSGSEGLMKIRIAKDFPEFDAEIARKIVKHADAVFHDTKCAQRRGSFERSLHRVVRD